MKKLTVILCLLTVSSVYAHALRLSNYIQMQESLAADDFQKSLEAHKTICTKELTHKNGEYKDCAKSFKSIEDLRTSFKSLSEIYIKHGDKKEVENLQKATCPMASARWIQKKGELRNPYYGKSMLDCGEKI
jgi:hypothetical protein